MFKNIFITLSIILNGGFLIYMTGILPFLLFIATIIIFALSWYIGQLLSRIHTIDSDFELLYNNLDQFKEHLGSIHELETFYGDDTLQSLIAHSRRLLEEIEDYQLKYMSDDVFDDMEDDEDEEEQDIDDVENTTPPPVDRNEE